MSELTPNVGIVGTHVEQSLSPVMRNAAYQEMGLDLRYGTFEIPQVAERQRAEFFAAFLDKQAEDGVIGLSVTMPFKVDALRSERVAQGGSAVHSIGAANTLSYSSQGIWHPDNTDWLGAVRSLEEQTEIRDKFAIVLGAGGTARAVTFGLAEQGISKVTVANRTFAHAVSIVDALQPHYPRITTDTLLVPRLLEHFRESPEVVAKIESEQADIVFNTTSIGQSGTPAPGERGNPFNRALLRRLRPGSVVADAVYMPIETALVRAARQRGDLKVIDGTRMLLEQAAEQVRIFTKEDDVPVEIMRKALQAEILRRQAASA